MSKIEANKENVKDEKKVKKKEKTVTIPTKVLVRRLPATMTEEIFLEYFSPFPANNMFRFVVGDKSLAPYNFCRAYIDFKNVNEILRFRDRWDGVNVECNGLSSMCLVEYAPYQKLDGIGRKVKKADAKCGTIFEDAVYKAFVESQEAVEEKEALDVEQYLEELEKREKKNEVNETPLTSYLKQKAIERKKKVARMREEKRKKDLEMKMKREEERKKRRELEKKKRQQENEKQQKQKKDSLSEARGSKTLAETRPVSKRDDNESKVKILQKEPKTHNSSSRSNSPGTKTKVVTLLKRPYSAEEPKRKSEFPSFKTDNKKFLAAKTSLKSSGFFDSNSDNEQQVPAKSSERKVKPLNRDERYRQEKSREVGGKKQERPFRRNKSPKSAGGKRYNDSKKFPFTKTRNPEQKASGSGKQSKDLDQREKRKPRPTQQFYHPKSEKAKPSAAGSGDKKAEGSKQQRSKFN